MLFHQVLVFCSDCMMILVDQNEILLEKVTEKSATEVRSKSGREKGLLCSLIILHRSHKEYLI